MKSVSGREFCKTLKVHGWTCQRISGSHHIYTKAGRVERISVPVHGSKPLKKGLQVALMKAARLKDDDL